MIAPIAELHKCGQASCPRLGRELEAGVKTANECIDFLQSWDPSGVVWELRLL